jgi:hypothetical protein
MTADPVPGKKSTEERMTTEEAIQVLSEIVRDEKTPASAKISGIRTLLQPQEQAGLRDDIDHQLERLLYDDD